MELKSLILGLIFGLGVFALKSGVGLGYLLTTVSGTKRRWLIGGVHVLAYLCLFLICGLLLSQVSLLDYFPQLQKLFAAGMTLHLISAILLGGWGFLLLKKRPEDSGKWKNRGWLLLSLPCPVCASVILLETAFMMNLYPDHKLVALVSMAAGFSVIQLLSGMILLWQSTAGSKDANQSLGVLMCLLAAYFLLALCIVPQFAQIDRIYRLSQGRGEPVNPEFVIMILILIAVVLGGYLLRRRNLKRSFL